MTDIPQPVVDNLVNQLDHQIPENDEQLAKQHDP